MNTENLLQMLSTTLNRMQKTHSENQNQIVLLRRWAEDALGGRVDQIETLLGEIRDQVSFLEATDDVVLEELESLNDEVQSSTMAQVRTELALQRHDIDQLSAKLDQLLDMVTRLFDTEGNPL